MANVVWVALPLVLYSVWVLGRHLTKRAIGKRTLELHASLLLVVYLLGTMGLGIFWVAAQQLPVFDLHYLLGYGSLLLVAVHLSFTLPRALRLLFRKRRAEEPAPGSARGRGEAAVVARSPMLGWLAAAAAVALSFFLGMRHGKSELDRLSGAPWSAATGSVATLQRYHEQSSLSRLGVFARAPSIDWGPEPARFKKHPGSERVPLPHETWDGAGRGLSDAIRGPDQATGPLSIEALAGILHHAAGITAVRGGRPLRAAPSSGALFPTEIYLAVEQIGGLAPGLYHYEPEAHLLERLAGTADSLGVPHLPPAPVAVILTVMLRRTGSKYGHRAYRYAVADAGHLLENLRIAAAEAGLEANPLAQLDEARVAAALGVDGQEEGVVALVSLGAVAAPALSPPHAFAPPPAAESSDLGVSAEAHAATSLRLLEEEGAGAVAPLPPPAIAAEPGALALIRARRSERRYREDPIGLLAVSTILADAARPPLLSDAIRIQVLARRLDGVAAGVYRYRPLAHGLERVRSGDLSAEARSAALAQDVIGDAAAVIVLSADRDRVFARVGARGYRHALLEMGMMGERILLGAVAQGLGACPVGAFYDDETAKLVGVDPAREWVLHMVALGAL